MSNRRLTLASLAAALIVAVAPLHAQKPTTIGVSLASDVNPFYVAMKRGIEARAKELGLNVVFVTANEVLSQQVNGIQDLVARKVDGIIASPIDSVAIGSAYDTAAKAGIPVISVARNANTPSQSAFVSMDEKKIGSDIAAWVVAHTGGKGKVAMITGPSGSATFRNLAEGFDAGLKKAPGMGVVYRKEVALSREMGLKQGEDILVANPDVVAIYAGNDELALGASQAVTAAGMKGQILITGMNGVPPALRAIKSGAIDLTVELNPFAWGQLGVDTMVRYLKGDKPSGAVPVDYVLIDKTNIDGKLPPGK